MGLPHDPASGLDCHWPAAARSTAKIWTAVGGIVAGLAGVGIITADQNTALQTLFATLGALVAAGTTQRPRSTSAAGPNCSLPGRGPARRR